MPTPGPKNFATRLLSRPARRPSYNWTTGGDPDIVHEAYIARGGFGEVHKVLNPTSNIPNVEDAKQDDRRG
jgi:hypothetical protein